MNINIGDQYAILCKPCNSSYMEIEVLKIMPDSGLIKARTIKVCPHSRINEGTELFYSIYSDVFNNRIIPSYRLM